MANAVLWRPLDLPEPNQLVQLGEGDKLNGNRGGVSASNFRDLAEHSRSFSRIAAMRTTALNLGGVGNPERLVGAEISEDYFSALRVEPQLGRFLSKADFVSGEHSLALISHRLWIRRFGAGSVRSVSSADSLPFAGSAWRRVFAAETASKGHKELMSYAAEVSPDYFETLRIRMLHGRGLLRQDNLGSPPVAVVSDYLAQRLFGKGKNPIGERIRLNGDVREIEIVGVVPNVQQSMLGTIRSQTMNLYLSQQQFCGQRAMVAVRTEKDSMHLANSIRKIVAEINPDLPLFAVRTMDELIALD